MSPPYCISREHAGVTTDGTLDVRRVALVRHLAGRRRHSTPSAPSTSRSKGNGIALYTRGVGAATRRRKPVRPSAIPVPVPGRDRRTPDLAGSRRRASARAALPVPIPPRWRRVSGRVESAAAAALTGGEAPVGQTVTTRLTLQARLAGHRLGDRRRPADRSRRRRRSSGRGDLHDRASSAPRAPRAAPSASSPTARIILVTDRRPPARVLDQDDQLRARPGARPARRRHRRWRSTAAARRRWPSTGTLLNRPSEPERADLDRPALPVHRRLRAAGRRRRLAGRRRRRATSRASATRSCAPSTVDGEAAAAGRRPSAYRRR